MKAKGFVFLLISTLFLFSCARESVDPTVDNLIGGGGVEKPQTDLNMTIGYLDDNFSTSETPTDIIALKYEGMPEGFDMIGQKLTTSGEYRVHLANAANNNFVMSFFYKPDSNFPYRIITSEDTEDEDVDGRVLSYNEASENFDIIWTMGVEQESSIDVPLSKDIFDYNKINGIGDELNYNISLILISVNMLDAIINHSLNDTAPTARFWKKIGAFFKKIFAPIVFIASVIVTAVAIVFAAPVVATVAAIVAISVATVAVAIPESSISASAQQDPPPAETQLKIIEIRYVGDNTLVKNGSHYEFYAFDNGHSKGEEIEFTIDVSELVVSGVSFKIYFDGEENDTATDGIIRNYYNFQLYDPVGKQWIYYDHEKPFPAKNTLINNLAVQGKYTIRLVKNYNGNISKNIYFILETTDENVSINGELEDNNPINFYIHKTDK